MPCSIAIELAAAAAQVVTQAPLGSQVNLVAVVAVAVAAPIVDLWAVSTKYPAAMIGIKIMNTFRRQLEAALVC